MGRLKTPLKTLKLVLAKGFIILYQRTWKMYFLSSQDFVNHILLVLSTKVIVYSMTFQYLRYKKVFLDENPKTRFLDTKKTT